MALTTLAIVLVAAMLHAFWNLVIARAQDTQAATAVALAVGLVVAIPFAVARWNVQPAAWPYIGLSTVIEVGYFWLLANAYRRAEMSLVYPVARGSAPVIVLLVSFFVLGVDSTLAQAAGVMLVGVGVVLVSGPRAGARRSDVAAALAVGATIAAYTLVDKEGVRYADPIAYLALIMVLPAIASIVFVASRGGVARLRAAVSPITVAGGAATFATYALVLIALTMAAAAGVAAVREVSVVIVAILGALVLKERVGPARFAGSVVVALGVALVVLG